MQFRVLTLLTAAVVVGAVLGSAPSAFAAPVDDRSIDPSVAALVNLTESVPADTAQSVLSSLATDPLGGAQGPELRASIAGIEVSLPAEPQRPVRLSSGDRSIDVSLPGAERSAGLHLADHGIPVYDNSGFSTVPLVKTDASVQFTTVIHDETAPRVYAYSFGDAALELQPDGLVTVRDAHGVLEGIVGAAWAVDAASVPVATHYEVEGSVLTQVVEHTAAQYPVVADPYLGLAQIGSITNAYRDPRGVTKVVSPTAWGRLNGNNPTAVNGMRDEYLAKVTSAYRTHGMWWQLACHMQFAPLKSEWNLDSYIVRGSYADYIANRCN